MGVVVRMGSAPITIRGQRQDTDPEPDTIRRVLRLEERSVTAIVLDHEKSRKKHSRGNGQRQ